MKIEGVGLGILTWPEVERVEAGLLAVPLGSTEQHGPHLPVDTDTRIAVALAEALAARRGDVVVAPAVAYGSSGEHAGFPGTLSIGQDVLEHLIVQLVRSADRWAAVVLVCGHGGNAEPLARALRTLRDEGRDPLAWLVGVPGGDAHAGRTETSLMLALAPEAVQMDRAEPGAPTALPEMLGRLRAEGVMAVAPNGVLGDPTGASVGEGEGLFARLVDDLCRSVGAQTRPTAAGRPPARRLSQPSAGVSQS